MSVEYFMDKCSLWEINDLIDNIPYTDRNLWESQRLISFLTGKANFKNIKSMDDICTFKWEKEDTEEEEHITEISDEDVARLKELSKKWEK